MKNNSNNSIAFFKSLKSSTLLLLRKDFPMLCHLYSLRNVSLSYKDSELLNLVISQQIVKILTFYNFRLACHNQTKLSLSLLSLAGGVKLRKYLSHIKMIISSIPLANQFPKLILDVIVSLTYIGNWSLPGEILLVCVTMRRGTMRTRRMTMGMKCMGSWQGAIYTRGRWHWPARKRTLHWLDINLI